MYIHIVHRVLAMKKDAPPPQLVVLLWHHFIFYKRHWVKFLITLLLPFLLFGGVHVLMHFLVGQVMHRSHCPVAMRSVPCAHSIESKLSDNSINFCISYIDRLEQSGSSLDRYKEDYKTVLQYMKTDIFNKSNVLNVKYRWCWPEHCNNANTRALDRADWGTMKMLLKFLQNGKLHDYDVIDYYVDSFHKKLHNLKIYFSPKTAETAAIMQAVNLKLNRLDDTFAALIKNKFPRKNYTLGFDTVNELLEMSQKMWEKPLFWDLLAGYPPDFAIEFDLISPNSYKYTMLYNPGYLFGYKNYRGRGHETYVLVQDLIERAMLDTLAPSSKPPPGLAFKETPSKCWNINADLIVYMVFPIPIALFIVISFLPCPSNFLHQVLTEKKLKLREYLYIVGVGSFTLKLSWILFYTIFLIPLSVVVGLLISMAMPGHIWNFTNPILIIVIFITYNISQLSLCYMYTNLLGSPKHSASLITFLHMFFTMTSIVQSLFLNFTGWKLTLARFSSLYPVTPLVFSVKYLTSWEQQWQAVQLNNFFLSPVKTDEYGGLGETFLWLFFDIGFYLILAWYFEKVFPGEFGQKQPFYFPIKPSFWFPNKFKTYGTDIKMDKAVDVESVSENTDTPGVVLDQLTKIYPGGKTAVDQLSLTFYKNQITAFLGQNGAGKSTTMNCLVGVTTATSGQVFINEMEMNTQMQDIRKIVGFVPQHDILYPSLTLEEHMQFFGWLKGMTKSQINEKTSPILTVLGLDHLKETATTDLSGGQKRKLSIITGYLGFPEVIIFDEPTSGIDPTSRRDIWELFLSNKKNNTTILSTHFMDEADILGDKVAIIHEGQLKCSGSPMYLKQKYGKGMVLTIARDETMNTRDEVIDFVTMNIQGSQLVEERGLDMSFEIPMEAARSDAMTDFLDDLEKEKMRIGIASYGLSESSMEKVFFETIGEGHCRPGQQQSNEDDDFLKLEFETTAENTTLLHTTHNPLLLMGSQAASLFYKRLLTVVYSWYIIILQICVPLVFIGLLLFVNGAFMDVGKSVDGEMNADLENVNIHGVFQENIMFVTFRNTKKSANATTAFLSAIFGHDKIPANMLIEQKDLGITKATCPRCLSYCKKGAADQFEHAPIPNEGATLYRLPPDTNITAWILSINQTGHTVIGGFLIQDTDETVLDHAYDFVKAMNNSELETMFVNSTSPDYVTVWYQEPFKFGVLNFINTILLRMRLGSTLMPRIELSFKQAQLYSTSDSGSDKSLQTDGNQTIGIEDFPSKRDNFYDQSDFDPLDFLRAPPIIVSGIFVTICFIFATIPSALFVQYEITSGLKRLQMIYGVNPIVYWIVNYVFDFTLFLITCGICYIPLVVFNNPYQPQESNSETNDQRINILPQLMSTIIVYGHMTILFYYLVSFVFENTKSIIIFIIGTSLGFTLIGGFLSIPESVHTGSHYCHVGSWGGYAWTVYVNAILRIFPAFLLGDSVSALTYFANPKVFGGGVECINLAYIESFDVVGKRQLYGVIMGIIFFVTVLLLEYFDLRLNFSAVQKLWQKKNKVTDELDSITDPDVKAENIRLGSHDSEHSDALVIRNLVKKYPKMKVPAVAGVSFGVTASQCFGLLGLNGAGKTTTFKILTGYTRPTSGEALLNNQALFSRSWSRFKDSSYCPQDNVLFPALTVEQHIKVFARFRAIPYSNITGIMNKLIHDVGLQNHRNKRAGQLSGGNQRKLQLALALLDHRPVIFLDEPTTGMDPGARRKAWNLIKGATAAGSAIVLTSHSMEECEVLCHRLVIMVAGTFHCIGSVQYLKDKFGNKYTFKIKLRPQVSDGHIDFANTMSQVKEFIKNNIASSELREEHATMFEFEVASTKDTNLPTIFKVLSKCRNEFAIEDISITQTTLEQLFINMSKKHEEKEANI